MGSFESCKFSSLLQKRTIKGFYILSYLSFSVVSFYKIHIFFEIEYSTKNIYRMELAAYYSNPSKFTLEIDF